MNLFMLMSFIAFGATFFTNDDDKRCNLLLLAILFVSWSG
jgi:hypothetical protein